MTRGPRTVVVSAAVVGAYLAAIRPRLLRWGATPGECRTRLPGEGIVAGAARDASTMAVTIDAPSERVWPWLVQMGCDRAGWYSFDRLDNGGRRSATQIVADWQHVSEGDRLAADTSGRRWFTVARVEPERALVLRASNNLRTLLPFDPDGDRPTCFTDGTWEFVLRPLDGDRTRLVVGGNSTGRPWIVDRLAKLLFWEPAHFVMQRKQFRELKRRAEAAAGGPISRLRSVS